MRLGIDFGTTRVVVAAVDRGNYPVVTFDGPDGGPVDWFPPLVAFCGSERRYGWDAWSAQHEPGCTIVRSLKRTLESAGPGTELDVDGERRPLLAVLTELVTALRVALRERSSLQPAKGEVLEVLLGVPANANSNQRFLIVEAFRQAGFSVLGLLNEPSAASIEFGHRNRAAFSGQPSGCVLVYDLGGGTFDVSLVEINERTHTVLASEGIPTLGGDDFDTALAELALDAADLGPAVRESLTQAELFHLHEECRAKKEALHPNTRRIVLDLECVRPSWGQVSVPVAAYYERVRPLVAETLHALKDLLQVHGLAIDSAGANAAGQRLEALYVTGGGSELPIVARVLREDFGRKVKRSAHSRAATAIGLAIQSDEQAGYVLRERFTRNFGVWREADSGSRVIFDPLFPKGTSLPGPGEPPLENHRSYCPVHNVGHFRYLECTQRADDGQPRGEITVWDDIRFPFDPHLRDTAELDHVAVTRLGNGNSTVVEETYQCDASGTVMVTIANRSEGYARQYRLGRWASQDAPVAPVRGRQRAAAKK